MGTAPCPSHRPNVHAPVFAVSLSRPTRRRLLVCLLLLPGLPGAGTGVLPALAQQPDPVEVVATARTDTPRSVVSVERKSPGLALALSVGGTAVPLFAAGFLMDTRAGPVLVGMGSVIGPSLGNHYAENRRRVIKGFKIRAAGATLIAEGMVIGLGAPFSESIKTVALVLIGTGLATMTVGAIYEIATAPVSAKEYNRTHDVRARVAPAVDPSGEQVGLTLQVSF